MTRRRVILALAAVPLSADDANEIWELLTQAAAALSAGNRDDFLQAFDRSMPGYQMLASNISGILAEYEVQSSVELLTEEDSGSARTIDLDWFLELVEQQDETNVTRRRDKVTCRLRKTGKKWKIVSLEPISFFAPPQRRG
jgi:predicted ATPase